MEAFMKKSVGFCLVFMLLTLMYTVMADSYGFCSDTNDITDSVSGSCGANTTWHLSSEGTLRISGVGAMDPYNSTSMPWYNYCSNITKLVVDPGVTSIGDYAFYGFTSLGTVELNDDLTTIGDSSFYGCNRIQQISLSSVLQAIGNNAFCKCTGLTGIQFPDGLKTIGESAFYGCSGITNIEVPQSVTSIDKGAFRGTRPLAVSLPFVGRSRTASTYSAIFGYIFGYERNDNASCTDAGQSYNNGDYYYHYLVPSTLVSIEITDATAIPASAFAGLKDVSDIRVNSSVTSIGSSAFCECAGITEFEIPAAVTSIGSSAFDGCTNLTSITIPSAVTNIDTYTFRNCSNLTSITLDDTISVINDCAFYNCTKLTDLQLPFGLQAIGNNAFCKCTGLTGIQFPYGLKTIGESAFYGCSGITSLEVPQSVTSIGKAAFQGTRPLTVRLPFVGASRTASKYSAIFGYIFGYERNDSASCTDAAQTYNSGNYYYHYLVPSTLASIEITDATVIPEFAFAGLKDISGIRVNSTVTSIGSSAFYACAGITEFDIPAAVTSIGNSAFDGCTALASVSCHGSDKDWQKISIGSKNDPLLNAIRTYTSLLVISVEDPSGGCLSCQVNDETPFIGQTSVELNISAEDVVTVTPVPAGGYFFHSWSDGSCSIPLILKEPGDVNLTASFSAIPEIISDRCFILPDALETIEADAFTDTSASCIVIPDGVTAIGANAFGCCPELQQIQIYSENVVLAENALSGIDKTKVYFFVPANSHTASCIRDLGYMVIEK